jgi:hypothetical protein
MRKKIGLVGVGSLGSAVAKQLQRHADTIYAVDPDIVEERNLRNSIYTKSDINQPKVTALQNKISECRFIPVNADIRDIDLPDIDEIIDCRDVLNRNIDTDVKFSIVGKSLRIDCEEVVFEKDKPGKYLMELEKDEVIQAGRLAKDITLSKDMQTLKEQKLSTLMPIQTKSVEPRFECLLMEREDTTLEIAECFPSNLNEVRDNDTIKIRKMFDSCPPNNYPAPMSFTQALALLRDSVLQRGCIYIVNRKDRCVDLYNLDDYGGA